MNSNSKIIVVKMREIIYTLLLLFLIILLIVCLVLMFAPKSDSDKAGQVAQNQTSQTQTSQSVQEQTTQTAQSQTTQTEQEQAVQTQAAPAAATYTPGVYTTPVTLGDSTVDVEVTVDKNRINSIRLVNLSETTAASFPLISPALDHIASQILASQSLENITCQKENKYTSQLLLSAISDALSHAQQ